MAYHLPSSSLDVANNRKRFLQRCGLDSDNTVFMNQSHSSDVVVVDSYGIYNCDALVTDNKALNLAVLVADCIPLFIYDTQKEVIAAIHAGRVGTFNAIVKNCIKTMQSAYGCESKDLFCYMGPSIHQCCYEVSPQMCNIVTKSFSTECVHGQNIDLQGINRIELEKLGVPNSQISVDTHCTCCNNDQFYSYRADKESAGRMVGIISMN